ncbi:class I SAM-dependent methyltransferase [Patescibacteria group bacterium]|nr:class I SAM-dependent methyltransferase [Patescibacteria group bacterium]
MRIKTISQDRKKEIEFWDEKSKEQRNWILKTSKEEIIKKILLKKPWWEKLIGKVKGKKILDIGCGNTYFATYWQLTGNDSYGSDFSPETIKNNKLLHKKLGLKQNFYVASSEKINSKDDFFDGVHMRWVVHHIPLELQDASIQEIKRVLKKGGKLIVFETNYAYPFRWVVQTPILRKINFLRKYAIKKEWLDPEEKALTNKGYLNLIERNGFGIEKVEYDFTFFQYPVNLLIRNQIIRNFAKHIDNFLRTKISNKFSKDIMIIAKK